MSRPLQRVVLDARWIRRQISGIGLYTRHLLRRLPAVAPDVHFTALFDDVEVLRREMAPPAGGSPPPNLEAVWTRWGPFSPMSQVAMVGWLADRRADVFHSTNFMIPFAAVARRGHRPRAVVTIHDLIPLLFPHYTPRARKTQWLWLLRRLMRWSTARASAVIVPSRSTADDVRRVLLRAGADASRVVVVPEAADPSFAAAPPGPHKPVVLFVGRRDPYKNLPLLVRAIARVRGRVPDVRLRVIGPPDARYPEPERAAREAGVEECVEWAGYVDGEGLAAAYRDAAVLALPSRYEGFGLPVLEAMASGLPVVCGNASSLPEVAGDAAVLVAPDDEAALADALVSVLTDPALAARLRERGWRRAAEFSWDLTARRTVEVYRAVCD